MNPSPSTLSEKEEAVWAPPIGRLNTAELNGRLYPIRSGRGDQLGEPLTDVRTRDEIIYIDWPEGDPEVSRRWHTTMSFMSKKDFGGEGGGGHAEAWYPELCW